MSSMLAPSTCSASCSNPVLVEKRTFNRAERMRSSRACTVVLVLVICLFPVAAVCQSALSANSGINSADTYVVVDLTITSSTTLNLPDAFYNPTTGQTSSVLTAAPPTQTLHVESGYDSNGGLVMNIWPTGTSCEPHYH